MNAAPKSTKDAPPDPPVTERPEAPDAAAVDTFTALFNKGVERIAELQKASLDMFARHNTETVFALKKAFNVPASMPGMFWVDLAGESFERLIDTQKTLIDLTVQHLADAQLPKQRVDTPAQAAAGMTDRVQRTVERNIAAHKAVTDFASRQTRIVTDAVKRQPGIAGTPAAAAAESVQRGVDIIIDTQKELVETAAKSLKVATAKA